MHQSQTTDDTPKSRPASGRRAKLLWIGGGLLVAVGLAAIWLLLVRASGIPQPFVKAQQAVAFPVFYPEMPPTNLTLNARSVSYTKEAVIYTYTYDRDKLLSVSIQPRRQGFDTSEFRPTLEFTTHIGRAYVVDLEERTSAAVVGDASWVLINAPERIAETTLREFIDSLRPVQPS